MSLLQLCMGLRLDSLRETCLIGRVVKARRAFGLTRMLGERPTLIHLGMLVRQEVVCLTVRCLRWIFLLTWRVLVKMMLGAARYLIGK